MTACRIVGPYMPVGDTDWECRTHGVLAILRDPSRAGAPDIGRADMVCPVAESPWTLTEMKTLLGMSERLGFTNDAAHWRAEIAKVEKT